MPPRDPDNTLCNAAMPNTGSVTQPPVSPYTGDSGDDSVYYEDSDGFTHWGILGGDYDRVNTRALPQKRKAFCTVHTR